MGRRRRRKRRLKGRSSGRDPRPERYVDVRVERNPKSRRKSAKVTKIRRRDGNVTEESYEA
jgi:hypothetical protein